VHLTCEANVSVANKAEGSAASLLLLQQGPASRWTVAFTFGGARLRASLSARAANLSS
jgi:hypothetical protein